MCVAGCSIANNMYAAIGGGQQKLGIRYHSIFPATENETGETYICYTITNISY